MIKFISKSLILVLLIPHIQLKSQNIDFYSTSSIISMLEKLNTLGKVLYVAAHPDDENTRLITYFANDQYYETAYLSTTRGDGGQNLLGSHLKEDLGIIRTQELLEARKIDGGKQFFTRAIDFGYSKSSEETLEFWDEEKILSDFVWVIRKFRPDIIITRFNQKSNTTHGHHTASSILANKAFYLSGDSTVFPDQLQHVKTWKAKRILWNTSSRYFNIDSFNKDDIFILDVGKFNKFLGQSYNEISSESRSMHKSQGFGSLKRRGSENELFILSGGNPVNENIMDDINTNWDRIEGGINISNHVRYIRNLFDPIKPHAIIPDLLSLYSDLEKIKNEHWKKIKQKEIKSIIKACSGLFFEIFSDKMTTYYNDKLDLNIEVINRSEFDIYLKRIKILNTNYNFTINQKLNVNKTLFIDKVISIPSNIEISEKYWLINKSNFGNFNLDDQLMIGKSDNNPSLSSVFYFSFDDIEIPYEYPIVYKKNNPIKGDDYQPLNVGLPVYIEPLNKSELLINSNEKIIRIKISSIFDIYNLKVFLKTSDKIVVEPILYQLDTLKKNEIRLLNFKIKINSEKDYMDTIKLVSEANNRTYDRYLKTINYKHIPIQKRFPISEIYINKFDFKKTDRRIAYFLGSGDQIPEALLAIGYNLDIISLTDITFDNLKKYDVFIIGIRAYNTYDKLKNYTREIMNFVENGGTVIVQYNTSRGIKANDFAPYDFNISRNRVSQENSSVKIIDPDHPVLNFPNKITANDFNGWVQERGLYFPVNWSKKYKTIISSNDFGESPNDGGILISKVGKGYYIYTSYSWFRQLPNGVKGAYKIFTNLISLKENDYEK